MTRRFANLLIWLALTAEIDGATFSGKWYPPLMYVGTALFRPTFSIVPWDVLVFITLALAWGTAKPRVAPLIGSMKLAAAVTAVVWIAGVLRGGSAYQTYFQLHSLVMGVVTALLVGVTCRTIGDVRKLGEVMVSACLYRSILCIVFYVTVAADLEVKLMCLTDHFDSVLFVTGWFVLLIHALQSRKASAVLWLVFGSVTIATALVLNNRRLAWAAVAAGLLVTFVLLEKSKLKRSLTRGALYLSPFLIGYVVAGWGNPSGIFRPVASISTMFGDHQDESSKMRDIENYNLQVTLRTNPVLGFGWGREYIEESSAIDIADIFPQYRYMPHNSLLGLVAFTGMLGLWGVWQMLAVSAFFHAKVYQASAGVVAKTAALTSLVAIVVVQLQMWGDLGMQSQMVQVVLAITIGLAQRLPLLTSVWAPQE